MQDYSVVDSLPHWTVIPSTVVVFLLSFEVGFRLGKLHLRRSEPAEKAPVGSMVGAMLGLLAFMLAFTFGMAGSRFDARRGLVLEEANALGTTYLRAALLPQPERGRIEVLLREYVDLRVQIIQGPGRIDTETLEQGMARTYELHRLLWSEATSYGAMNPGSVVGGLFIQSLNDVIDLHSKRLTTAFRNRIPPMIWAVLVLVAILSMSTMGYHAGLNDTRSLVANCALIMAFSAVMFLIADLDRGRQGLLRVSQQALVDVQENMREQPR